MKFKPKNYRDTSAFFVCWELECKEESTRIWADSETAVLDLCDNHYQQAMKERLQ
jgi:hypothetical protein